jgi:hypothetical protein
LATEAEVAFVSYSSADKEFALRLAEDLKAGGANIWLDQIDINPGEPWDLAVELALKNCAQILVILSPVSAASPNVLDEIAFALSRGKRAIPVLYKDCDIPFRLHRIHYLDFRTDYSKGLKGLLRTLGIEPKSFAEPTAVLEPRATAEAEQVASEERKVAEQAAARELERKQAAERAAKEAREQEQRQAAEKAAALELERKQAAERAAEADRKLKEKQAAEQAVEAARKLKEKQDYKTGTKGRRSMYVVAGAAAVLLILGFVLIPIIQKSQRLSRLQPKDWTQVLYNDADFSDCMNFAPCQNKKVQAAKILAVADWQKIHDNDGVLLDCMGNKDCLAAKAIADELHAITKDKGWLNRKIDDPIFKTCMSYQPCLDAKKQAGEVPKVQQPNPDREKAPTTFNPFPSG